MRNGKLAQHNQRSPRFFDVCAGLLAKITTLPHPLTWKTLTQEIEIN
jgi:hypothetical protein